MATYKSTFKRFNGSTWDIHYFKTTADLIEETTNYKVLTAAERTSISSHLTTFQSPDYYGEDAANLIVKVGDAGLITANQIQGGLPYLPISNPTFTGVLSGPEISAITDGNLLLKDYDGTHKIEIKKSGAMTFTSDVSNGFSFTGGNIAIGSNKITGVSDPTSDQDAATKKYVDTVAAEGAIPVAPVKAATTGNIVLQGALTIDGFATTAGDRILVRDQTVSSENGIYTVDGANPWTKVAADSIKGALVFVENGSTYNDYKFYADTATSWIVFSKIDVITADEVTLTKTGTQLKVANGGISNVHIASAAGIASSKLASEASDESDTWANISNASVSSTYTSRIQDILSAIKNLRGTTNFNTSNTQTIADAYTKIGTKNSTYIGTTDPLTTGYVTGDLYFQEIV